MLWNFLISLAVAVVAYLAMSRDRSVTAESPGTSRIVRLVAAFIVFNVVSAIIVLVKYVYP